MRQQVFGFILEARTEPSVRLDRETEQNVVKLMAALVIAVFEANEETTDAELDESA
jgi:hypothetical protein